MGCRVAGLIDERWNSRQSVSRKSFCNLLLASAAILAAGSVAQAEDVNITSNTTSGVDLNSLAGTTARVFPGVTVSNSGTPTGPGAAATAIYASTHAWTLNNDGIVAASQPAAYGVFFAAGGTVNNASSIASTTTNAAVGLTAGGTVNNLAAGTISGSNIAINITNATGTVNNAGTISNYILVTAGGTITNQTGATISTAGAGNVAVTLRGGADRTVTNSGTIRSTGTGFATGVEIGSGTGTGSLTNQSSGTIFGTYNGVFAGGSVVLNLTNNGTIQSTNGPGVEARGGGTFVNSGLIESSSDGMLIAGAPAASITNSGTIRSNGAGRAIVFSGSATHTLTLNTGSVLGGNVQGSTGIENLILQGSGTESIAKFLAFETLSMQGADWSVTGTGAFTTSTAVQNGTLRVNGTLTTPSMTIAGAGTLGGNGTIVSNVVNNGTIAPGNSIGTLNITGNYTQATGSTYRVEVNTTPASDLINITGTATIQGGAAVNVVAAPGLYTVGQRYTILTAAGGRTGTYATLSDNMPFVDFQLAYDPNNVFLDVSFATVAFQDVAQTPNQRAAAGGAQSLGAGNPVFDAVIMQDTPNALRAFDLLSGEIHASINGTLIEDSRFLREAVGGRLRQFAGTAFAIFAPRIATLDLTGGGANALAFETTAFAYASKTPAGGRRTRDTMNRALASNSAPESPTVSAWAQGFGNWGRTNGDGNAATLNRNTGGLVSGVDVTLPGASDDLWRAGIAGAFQHTSVDIGERNSSGTIESRHLAAYAGVQRGPLGMRGGASYGWSDVSTSRIIAFPGFSDATRANYGGRTAQVFGEAGYAIRFQHLALEPFAGLSYINVQTEGFAESGGAAALMAASGKAGTTFSTLGLRAAAPLPFVLPGDAVAIAKGSAGWRYAFGTITPTSLLSFSNAQRFTVAGVPIAKDAVALELGLDGRITRNDTIGISYVGQIAGPVYDHGVSAQYMRRF